MRLPLAGTLRRLPGSRDGADRSLVALIWMVASVALFVYVYQFGRNMPYWDDFEYVPVLSGARAFDLSWLVEQTLEHRYVLAKLIQYPLWLATHDFRTPLWIDALALSALAACYMLTLRELRGRTMIVDAFFPLFLLHWGHHENLIFFVQLCFVLPVILISAAIILIATHRWRTPGGTVALAAAVALLPLNGAMGVLLSLPLIVWCAGAAWATRGERRVGITLAFGCAVSALFVALYFQNHAIQTVSHNQRSLETTLRGTFELLCVIFGPPGMALWPVLGIAVLAVCAAVAVMLVRNSRLPGEGFRASGLLACLASLAALIVGIGYGRGVIEPGAGYASRYCLLTAPALCIVFVCVQLYTKIFLRRCAEMLLFITSCVIFIPNAQTGLAYAHARNAATDALVDDLSSGMRIELLAQRYAMRVYPVERKLSAFLAMMRDSGIGPYAHLPAFVMREPACHEVEADAKLETAHDVTFGADGARGTSDDPFLVYALAEPTRVCAVRIDYDVDNFGAGRVSTQVFWKDSAAGEEFDGAKRNTMIVKPAGAQSQTFWIDSTIDHFRFDPDIRPCAFHVRGVKLLVEDKRQ